jgi:glycosyltransferase involved in cell wall biosynthesis
MSEHVVLVIPRMDVGGAQESALTLARHLPAVGWEASVATFMDGPMRARFEEAGVAVDVLADRRHRAINLPGFAADMRRMRRDLLAVMDRRDARVVQIQTLGTLAFVVAGLRRGGRARVLWRIANVTLPGGADGIKGWLQRRAYRSRSGSVDAVVAVSDEVAEAFVRATRVPRDRVRVVLNAVDTDRLPAPVDREAVRADLGLGSGDRAIVCVASFKEQKGHRYLVEAVRAVGPEHPEMRVLLLGDGDLRERVQDQVQRVGLDEQIRFLGRRDDVAAVLAASDGFVLPSLWEGFSMALAEAMASEVPVIATAVSGTVQVLRDGLDGWLVPPGDAAALAGALREWVADPAGARERARSARARIEDGFGAAAQAERYAALFAGREAVHQVVAP